MPNNDAFLKQSSEHFFLFPIIFAPYWESTCVTLSSCLPTAWLFPKWGRGEGSGDCALGWIIWTKLDRLLLQLVWSGVASRDLSFDQMRLLDPDPHADLCADPDPHPDLCVCGPDVHRDPHSWLWQANGRIRYTDTFYNCTVYSNFF